MWCVQLNLECTECSDHMRQALIRGESHGLVIKGVEIRSGHVERERNIYGLYHLGPCLAVKIQFLYICVGGDSA
jgi:hypothetical protein